MLCSWLQKKLPEGKRRFKGHVEKKQEEILFVVKTQGAPEMTF